MDFFRIDYRNSNDGYALTHSQRTSEFTMTPFIRLASNAPLKLVRLLHGGYKLIISPLLGNRCRFYPTCSDYALEAVEERGLLVGSALALGRVCRCNPIFEGGFDPVPKRSETTCSHETTDKVHP